MTTRLDDPKAATSECADSIVAHEPAWSADGSLIAFLAAPDAVGRDGFARLEVMSNLYLMAPNEANARVALEGIADPRDLEFSPDGRWLALSGERPLQGAGVWLYEIGADRLIRVFDRPAGALAFAGDGTRLFALVDVDVGSGALPLAEVWEIGLASILHEAPNSP